MSTTVNSTFSYDDINRVTNITHKKNYGTTTATGARSESYAYDDAGNRTMTGYSTAGQLRLDLGRRLAIDAGDLFR
jgi:uncharacterized protein RhaS with RHS repeats